VDDLLLLYGQEVTTYYGHMNVWGTRRWCDFRAKTTTDIAAIIALAHAQGGLCSINHPKIGGPPWEYGYELPVDTLEVWQGPWPYRNDESLALWDQRLCAGKEIRAVGGSDYHCPAGEETNLLRLGQPTTWVLAKERSHRGVLEAIHAGRATVSAHPQGPRLLLTATAGDHSAMMGEVLCRERTGVQVTITVWRGAGYDVQIIVDGQVAKRLSLQEAEQQITVPVQARTYIRAEVIGDPPAALIPDDAPSDLNRHDWRWALSNPIFIGRADQ
ncbi:MAG: CehA/McbA family metallohydrolase, partial [Caldilineaceae bacterium]|nr:CehA/McbA family metallohydrolase [Caldilineaceae bacterium]